MQLKSLQFPMRLVVNSDLMWHASFPDLPAIQVRANSPEIAGQQAQALLVRTLYTSLNNDGGIPRPSKIKVGEHAVSLPDELMMRIKEGCEFYNPPLSLEWSNRLGKLNRAGGK